jgi:hypothetical protein
MFDLLIDLLTGLGEVAGDLAEGAGDLLADGVLDVAAAGDILQGVDLLAVADPDAIAALLGAADLGFDPQVFIPMDLAATTVTPDLSAFAPPSESVFSVGDPLGDALFFDPQWHSHSCAVACQTMVLESFLGQDIPESFLGQMALDNGWYTPLRGTDPSHLASSLEAVGVPVETSYGTNVSDLIGALERGDKVIVGLDSLEITNPLVDGLGVPVEQAGPGHAVMVTELGVDKQGEGWVTINDPGSPDGAGKKIPWNHFENAWNDHDRLAVIAKGGLPHVA